MASDGQTDGQADRGTGRLSDKRSLVQLGSSLIVVVVAVVVVVGCDDAHAYSAYADNARRDAGATWAHAHTRTE